MSFLKDKPQMKKGLRVAEGHVDPVDPPPEYDFVIALNNGSFSRENPENIDLRHDHIRVNGPGKGEYATYPMSAIAYFGKQRKGSTIQSSNGKDAA